MSCKLILDNLKLIKPLVKANGLPIDRYGVVKDGMLYFNNSYIEVQVPIDIPFDCAIDLNQLYVVLYSIKGESVIVNKEHEVFIHHNDTTYKIDTIVDFDHSLIHPEYQQHQRHSCDNPQVLKRIMELAEDYTLDPTPENVDFIKETLLIVGNYASSTDSKNVIEAVLDFGMPDCAFLLPQIAMFNKIVTAKSEIVAFSYQEPMLGVHLNSGVSFYIKSVLPQNPEKARVARNRFSEVVNARWVMPNIVIPAYVKAEIALLGKLNAKDAVHWANSFVSAGSQRIDFASFTDEPFSFKCSHKHLKSFLHDYIHAVHIGDRGLSFISTDQRVRGYIGAILSEIPNAK